MNSVRRKLNSWLKKHSQNQKQSTRLKQSAMPKQLIQQMACISSYKFTYKLSHETRSSLSISNRFLRTVCFKLRTLVPARKVFLVLQLEFPIMRARPGRRVRSPAHGRALRSRDPPRGRCWRIICALHQSPARAHAHWHPPGCTWPAGLAVPRADQLHGVQHVVEIQSPRDVPCAAAATAALASMCRIHVQCRRPPGLGGVDSEGGGSGDSDGGGRVRSDDPGGGWGESYGDGRVHSDDPGDGWGDSNGSGRLRAGT
jgi:hypothetical protein